MSEQPKKGFLQSLAFKLIIVWLIMGVALSVAVKYAVPKIGEACEEWARQENIPVPEVSDYAYGAACKTIAYTDGAEHQRLAAALYPLLHGFDLALAWNIPNFLIFITLLAYFIREPLNKNLKTRREDLEKAIADAKAARAEAEALLAEYEDKFSHLDREVEKLKAEFRSQAEADKARIVAEAERLAERIRNEAEFTTKQELLMAQYKLREEAAKLAVEIAEKVIREVINDEDQERLLAEYLDKVKEQTS